MNRIQNMRIQLPGQFAKHSDYISDQVREGISQRQWRGNSHIEQLSLGTIETTQHTTPDELASEILGRIDKLMEQNR